MAGAQMWRSFDQGSYKGTRCGKEGHPNEALK